MYKSQNIKMQDIHDQLPEDVKLPSTQDPSQGGRSDSSTGKNPTDLELDSPLQHGVQIFPEI